MGFQSLLFLISGDYTGDCGGVGWVLVFISGCTGWGLSWETEPAGWRAEKAQAVKLMLEGWRQGWGGAGGQPSIEAVTGRWPLPGPWLCLRAPDRRLGMPGPRVDNTWALLRWPCQTLTSTRKPLPTRGMQNDSGHSGHKLTITLALSHLVRKHTLRQVLHSQVWLAFPLV